MLKETLTIPRALKIISEVAEALGEASWFQLSALLGACSFSAVNGSP